MRDEGLEGQSELRGSTGSLCAALLLAACAILPFAWGGFLVDDWFILAELAAQGDPAEPSLDPWRFFLTPFQDRYDFFRPLIGVSYWADWKLHGLNAHGYVVTNLLLHLVSGALLFRLIRSRRPQTNPWAIGVGALFFMVFPAQVEPVAWIAARSESLSWCFGVGALLCIRRLGVIGPSSCLLLFCALLCKESAIVFVPALFIDASPRGDSRSDSVSTWKQRLRAGRAVVLTVLLYLVYRFIVFGGLGIHHAGKTLFERAGADLIPRLNSAFSRGFLPLPPDMVVPYSIWWNLIHLIWGGVLCAAFFGFVLSIAKREWRQVLTASTLVAIPLILGVMVNEIEFDLRNSRTLYIPVAAVAMMLTRALDTRASWVTVAAGAALVASLILMPITGMRYVENANAVRHSVESLQQQLASLPDEKTVAVVHGLHSESYFGGLNSLVGSLPHAVRPPFMPRRFQVEFTHEEKGSARGPIRHWRDLDAGLMATRAIFIAVREGKEPQTFRSPIPAANKGGRPAPRLIAPAEAETIRFEEQAPEQVEARFRFELEGDESGLIWRLVILEEDGILIDHEIPESSLEFEASGTLKTCTARLVVSRAAIAEVRDGGRLAWTVYALQDGKLAMPAPPFVFFDLQH